jgi:hypothetical protein
VVEFTGQETTRPTIDHEATPDGLCGSPAMHLTGVPFADALVLVRAIRGDDEN